MAAKLRGYIFSRVNDRAAAEDIVQDVFLKAHQRINQLESEAKVESWIYGIARNAVVDFYRKKRPTVELPGDLVADSENNTEEEAEPLKAAFREMVYNLPEPYREALVLSEFEGLSQKELAEKLGISVSGAKSRVQRAREKLKEAVLECCALEFDRRGNVIECAPRKEQCDC